MLYHHLLSISLYRRPQCLPVVFNRRGITGDKNSLSRCGIVVMANSGCSPGAMLFALVVDGLLVSVLFFTAGSINVKFTSFTGFAGKNNFTSEQLGQFAANGEAQAGATILPASTAICLLKGFKNNGLLFFGNTNAGIL